MTLGVSITIFGLAVVFQALFAGYETGFISANRIRIGFQAVEEKSSRAGQLLRHIQKPHVMLTMLLIGTNIGTIMATIATGHFLNAAGEYYQDLRKPLYAAIATSLLTTPILLLFGEIIPKSVFRTYPNRLSLALWPVIWFWYWVLAPIAWPVAWLSRALTRGVGAREEMLSPLMSTLEDVRVLVDESAAHGTIEREEQRMIHSVIDLQNKHAKEVLVPRIDVLALPDTGTRDELLALFVSSGRTRIPIYHETLDAVIGVANAHDVMLDSEPDNQDIKRFIREVMHVPDTMTLDVLLNVMKQQKQHLAVVTDEYGGTDGIITLEDILEEIFGEIQDEHDREESPIHRVGPRAYVVDARMSLEEAAKALGAPIEDEEVETVGGWLLRVAGRIPVQGEVLKHSGVQITVLDAGPARVDRIRLEVIESTEDKSSGKGN